MEDDWQRRRGQVRISWDHTSTSDKSLSGYWDEKSDNWAVTDTLQREATKCDDKTMEVNKKARSLQHHKGERFLFILCTF